MGASQSEKKSPKRKHPPQDKRLEHWLQLQSQAKLDGKTELVRMYENIIQKLKGKE